MSALGRRRPAICSRFTARATSLNCSSQLTATSTPTAANYLATSSIASILPYATTTSISSSQGAWFATSGGSVGIGTTGPGAKLEVTDGASAATTDTLLVQSDQKSSGS